MYKGSSDFMSLSRSLILPYIFAFIQVDFQAISNEVRAKGKHRLFIYFRQLMDLLQALMINSYN